MGREYFHNPAYRVEVNLKQQKYLYERFGHLDMGRANPAPEPLIDYGMVLLPEVFGCEVVFEDDALPWAMPLNLSDQEIMDLEVPDVINSPPMQRLITQMDCLQSKYGRISGSINPTGVQNLALKIRGDQLYIDYFENPELAHKVLSVSTQAILQLTAYMKKRTGILAPGVTPMARPEIFVTPNCTVFQISNETFETYILQYENMLAEAYPPFGIHHCGSGDEVSQGYAKVKNLVFLEVGPNTDLVSLRQLMPEVHINARVDPVRMLNCTPEEIAGDVRHLIDTGGPLDKLSIDAVGCDYGTPDQNVEAMLKTAREYSMAKTS